MSVHPHSLTSALVELLPRWLVISLVDYPAYWLAPWFVIPWLGYLCERLPPCLVNALMVHRVYWLFHMLVAPVSGYLVGMLAR